MDINGQHQIRSQTLAGIRPPTKSIGNRRRKKSKSKLGSLEAGFRENSIYNAGVWQNDLSVGKKLFLKVEENLWPQQLKKKKKKQVCNGL